MIIKKYEIEDTEAVMDLIREEGEDWMCYVTSEASEKYQSSLLNSITYVAFEDEVLCGFSRSFHDCDLYIYVLDLLVKPKFRGRSIGRQLIECIYKDYSVKTVYVLSGIDEYYEKQGYHKEGSIFSVPDSSVK